jgi:hypothetical protein
VKSSHRVSIFAPALGALAVLITAGPVQAYDRAAPYDRADFVPPEGQALIVFIQNLKPDEKMTFTVFDPDKVCVAEVGGREIDIVPTKPGGYTYYVTGFNKTRRIDIDLEAGRTYFIRLFTNERPMTRVPDVELVRRASDSYLQLKFWMENAFVTHAKDDTCRGKPLKERANRTQKRINEANADWKSGDDAHRAHYTLHRRDGLIEKDLDWL